MKEQLWDVIVVGGGAAGLSAALMLGRARRRVLVIDAGSPRNRFAAHMHGVLGNEGAEPLAVLERGRGEAAGYGVEFRQDAVKRVEETPAGVLVTLEGGDELDARALVVTTGLSDELPTIPGLAERWGTSVLHCPYCHGWEVRDQRLGVLTTSPLGLHQAELIRQWSDTVTVFTAGLGEVDAATEQRLRSRGIRLVSEPVAEVIGDGSQVTAVRTEGGAEIALDAIFTAGVPRPHDGFLASLGLDRDEGPMGSFIAVDQMGKTSRPRVWAAGNVVAPFANVPQSMGAGSFVGAAVNATLVTWDFDAAVAHGDVSPHVAPADYWEGRYADASAMWSGHPNQALVSVVSALTVGRALDLGCGEGADAIWLAEQGWAVTGIDISPTAVDRATRAASDAGVPADRIRFVAADLATFGGAEEYDLVTASFLHSPVEFPRSEVLRRAADRVARGGHLLIASHAGAPPWAPIFEGRKHNFLSPEEEIEALDLAAADWITLIAETRSRPVIAPDGQAATLDDAIVLLQRR